MTDYEDYENNLAFPPTTDRTQSTIELVEKIEQLTKWLDLKSEYIEKLETENKKLKEQLEKAIITLQALGVTVTVNMELDE